MTLNVGNVNRWLTHISAVAYGSLSQSCQWLSPVTQTKITKVHLSGTGFGLRCSFCKDSSISLKPDNPVDWSWWIVATHHYRWSQGNLTWWNSKLETVKVISTPRKINTILINIKINQPNLLNMYGYKLATNLQNFIEIYLTWVKLLQKVSWGGGYFFDSHCISDVSVLVKCNSMEQTLRLSTMKTL